MVSIKSLFLFATTALAAAAPQDAFPAQIAGFKLLGADLIALDHSVKALTTSINLYLSGVVEAAPIFAGFQGVNIANRKAYNDALWILSLNSTQSLAIIKYVANPIAVDIPISTKALEAKKISLVAAGLKNKILFGLSVLLADHESLSAAIAGKLFPLTVAHASAPVTTIDLAIREAITHFSI